MNVFYLDTDPQRIASWLVDKHIVKMPVESAQMLSTAHRLLDGRRVGKDWILPDEDISQPICYKVAHAHHPSTVWTMASKANYEWHAQLWVCMLEEYTRRYGRIHNCSRLMDILMSAPKNISDGPFTSPPLAMPQRYKSEDAVSAYRRFYAGEKWRFARWKQADLPDWFLGEMQCVWLDEGYADRAVALEKAVRKKTPPMDVRVLSIAKELTNEVA